MREQFWDKIALKKRTPWALVLVGLMLGIAFSFATDKVTSHLVTSWTDKVIHSQQKVVWAATAQLEEQLEKEYLAELEALSAKTNRSRNELINILLEAAMDIVKVED